MKYLIAVSGGVDSVVLLDMLVNEGKHEIVVAHFDHGIRPDSDADARFVAELAKRYGLKFETARIELGSKSSEEKARDKRYEFLRKMAMEQNAKIVTAHHGDDIVETVAINLKRGTGWRGLAVLNSADIERPLLKQTKQELYDYAIAHNLEWVEDETNATDAYLRNRLRKKIVALSENDKQKILELHANQKLLAELIDAEAARLSTNSRYFYNSVDTKSADEILRNWLGSRGLNLTRPQRERLLLAISTFKPSQMFEAGPRVKAVFTARNFVVK